MLLIHQLQTRLFKGAGAGAAPAPATDILGRRRRTRRYRTPNVQLLEQNYTELAEVIPTKVLKPLIGAYLLRGDMPRGTPPSSAVDWSALIQDTEAVIRLMDAYLEYIEEEDISVLLLGV